MGTGAAKLRWTAAISEPSTLTPPRMAQDSPDIERLFEVWETAGVDEDWEDAKKVRTKFEAKWAAHLNRHLEWRAKKKQLNSKWETILLKDDGRYTFALGAKRETKKTMEGLWIVDDDMRVGLTGTYDPENGFGMPLQWFEPKEFASRFDAERNDAYH